MIASGCVTPPPTGTAEQMCQDWREIGVRKGDVITPETEKEIVGNNVARQPWCVPKKA